MENNTFSIRRFALYARKHYWENRLFYLLLIVITAIAIVPLVTSFEFMPLEVEFSEGSELSVGRTMSDIMSRFTVIFYVAGVMFISAVLERSAYGAKEDNLNMNNMLLPVSIQERFWFVIFNTIVVANIAFVIIFYASSSYVETLYLFSDNKYVFQGVIPWGNNLSLDNLEYRNIFSFSDLVPNMVGTHKFVVIMVFSSIYLYYIAVSMWGSVTFNRLKRYQLGVTLLSHIVLFIALGALLVYINNIALGTIESANNELILIGDNNSFKKLANFMAYSSLIPALVYFFVTYKKLKTLEIYN